MIKTSKADETLKKLSEQAGVRTKARVDAVMALPETQRRLAAHHAQLAGGAARDERRRVVV